jgi:ribosomal protein S6--L-glutamate ligase
MAGQKVGFYKAVQGAFTETRIAEIKRRLTEEHGFELVEVDFRDGVLIDGKVYVGDICLNELDVYFWHDTIWPSVTGADSYYLHLLRAIEKDVSVLNSADSTEVVNDKLRAHTILHTQGLPVSRFALLRGDDIRGTELAFKALGEHVLIKPRFGGWGTGIVKCQTLDELRGFMELCDAMNGKHHQFLLEQYYENDPKGWTSVSMVGPLPVIAYRKPLSLGNSDWKIYDPEKLDGRGEKSEYVKPSEELILLAQRAQRALGKDIVGFDFILTQEGYKIVDENGRPGLYEHCLEAANVNIVDVVTDLIVDKAEDKQ